MFTKTEAILSFCEDPTLHGEMTMVCKQKKLKCSDFNLPSDNSVEDYLSQVTKSSLDVHIGSLRSVSDNKNMRRKFRDEMALGQCVSNGSNDRISKWVSNSANQGNFDCRQQI